MLYELYGNGSSTRSQIQQVVEYTQSLSDMHSACIDSQLNKVLHMIPDHVKNQPDVTNALLDLHTSIQQASSPFRGMETEKRRVTEFIKEGLVQPQRFVIGHHPEPQSNGTVKMVDCHVYYVPIINTLCTLLPAIEPQLTRPMRINEELRYFTDGSIYKSSQWFRDNPEALQIVLYNDDIEIANPLGSRAGVHKLTMFYFSVGSQNTSKLDSIHLIAVCYASDLKEFGYNQVLRPLVEDLKSLYVGVTITSSSTNSDTILKAALVNLVGDNLAANAIIGMVESFSARYYCRFCLMDSTTTRTAVRANKDLLRFDGQHQQHVRLSATQEDVQATYGVKRVTILDELIYFSSIEGTVADCMHDLLEGVCKLELSLLLTRVVHKKYISLKEINQRILYFNYG